MIHNGSELHQMKVNIAENCVLPLATIFTSLWARKRESWKATGVGRESKYFPDLPTHSLCLVQLAEASEDSVEGELTSALPIQSQAKSAAGCLAVGAPRKAGSHWLQRMNLASFMHHRGAELTNMFAAGSVIRRLAECMLVHGTRNIGDADG